MKKRSDILENYTFHWKVFEKFIPRPTGLNSYIPYGHSEVSEPVRLYIRSWKTPASMTCLIHTDRTRIFIHKIYIYYTPVHYM